MELNILRLKKEELTIVKHGNYESVKDNNNNIFEAASKCYGLIKKYAKIVVEYDNDLNRYAQTTPITVLTNLQIIFLSICPENGTEVAPCILEIFNEMIFHQCKSKKVLIRNWAFKCSVAIALTNRRIARIIYNLCNEMTFSRIRTNPCGLYLLWPLAK